MRHVCSGQQGFLGSMGHAGVHFLIREVTPASRTTSGDLCTHLHMHVCVCAYALCAHVEG